MIIKIAQVSFFLLDTGLTHLLLEGTNPQLKEKREKLKQECYEMKLSYSFDFYRKLRQRYNSFNNTYLAMKYNTL